MAIPIFLALLLAASALHKVLARHRLAPVTARLIGVPLIPGSLLLLAAATIEALSGLALMHPQLRIGGALAAATLWTVYTLALFRRRGEVLDCGCDLLAREKPIGALTIARPALLAALAAIVATSAASFWSVDAPFAALALLALWFAATEISAIPSLARSRT